MADPAHAAPILAGIDVSSMKHKIVCALVALLLASPALGQTLPLPPTLIGSASSQGQALLRQADATEAYFSLVNQFLTQQTQTYCGVASLVMVLNAIGIPAPSVPAYEPYHVFTQDNVLNTTTAAVLSRETIEKQGITLDQLGGLFASYGLDAGVHHASDLSLDDFRAKAREALATPGQFVVVNYLRKAMGQEQGGHISPLAAYDAQSDRFLILDVARYKYPPVWVEAESLFQAMNTPDSDNGNRSRGFILVSR